MIAAPDLTAFDARERTYFGKTRVVYTIGTEGPPVLLMHEIPGITPDVLRLAKLIADAGFRVALPSLFGTDGKAADLVYTASVAAKLCIDREFAIFAADQSSAAVDWLRELCKDWAREIGAPYIGAVGLCLTGGFALALTVGTNGIVIRPVMSEPALPIYLPLSRNVAAMHLTAAERAELANSRPPCVGLRFSNDSLCRNERFQSYQALLGDAFTPTVINSPDPMHAIKAAAHSVLTTELSDTPGHPTELTLRCVFQFLRSIPT
jgi:dienelactone hydrolase